MFGHPLFIRTGTPKLTPSDIILFSDFEPGWAHTIIPSPQSAHVSKTSIEIPYQVGYLLTKAQDETSILRRGIDRLRGHSLPHLGTIPRSQYPHSATSFLGKDNDEQTSLYQPDSIVHQAGIQSPYGANSPPHFLPPRQSEYLQQVGFKHCNHPSVEIHPPTSAPMSPHEGLDFEAMTETSPAFPFTVPIFSFRLSSPNLSGQAA